MFGIFLKDKVLGGIYLKLGIVFVLMFLEEIIGFKRIVLLLKFGKIIKLFFIFVIFFENNFCWDFDIFIIWEFGGVKNIVGFGKVVVMLFFKVLFIVVMEIFDKMFCLLFRLSCGLLFKDCIVWLKGILLIFWMDILVIMVDFWFLLVDFLVELILLVFFKFDKYLFMILLFFVVGVVLDEVCSFLFLLECRLFFVGFLLI